MREYRIISPVANLREAPDDNALRGKLESELVYGETFVAEEEKDGWAKGYSAHDGYKGYVKTKHLGAPEKSTHIVTAIRSHLYRDATMKSPWLETFSFGSRVAVAEQGEKFSRLSDGSWIFSKHLSLPDAREPDYVATALKFLETPYYWGGRSGFGLDCSGLTQVCLAHAGIKIERDTDQQVTAIGSAVNNTQRGDIVYFPGHVGIMTDEKNIVHANAFHMKVKLEPLADLTGRGETITAIKRLSR